MLLSLLLLSLVSLFLYLLHFLCFFSVSSFRFLTMPYMSICA